MKKRLKKFLALLMCIFPVSVHACPHIDTSGNMHLQTYNAEYTEMGMIYPKEGYLYMKTVPMFINEVVPEPYENEIINETYSFSIIQDASTYMGYYWFTDEAYYDMQLEDIDFEITVKETPDMRITSNTYDLLVGLSNTYNEGIKFESDTTNQVNYHVLIENSSTDNYKSVIESNEINVLNNEVLTVDTEYMVVTLDGMYSSEYIEINDLYDEITVIIKDVEEIENPVVVNLDNFSTEEDFIEAVYEDGNYVFTIKESGPYVIANSFEIKEISEPVIEPEEEEVIIITKTEDKEETDMNIAVIVVPTIIVLSIIGIVIVIKKNN
ncbi:MAG: hypothetical protein R3Y13_05195 [bacterium]